MHRHSLHDDAWEIEKAQKPQRHRLSGIFHAAAGWGKAVVPTGIAVGAMMKNGGLAGVFNADTLAYCIGSYIGFSMIQGVACAWADMTPQAGVSLEGLGRLSKSVLRHIVRPA